MENNNNYLTPDSEDFPLTMEGLRDNKKYLKEQRELGNPNYQYKGNCTKAFTEKLVEKYIDREWEWVRNNDLPEPTEFPISDKTMENEIKTFDKGNKEF